MEADEDIEDGEILEDESSSSEQTFQNKEVPHEESTEFGEPRHEVKNNFETFFNKEKRNHHHHHHHHHRHESHKPSRRERFSDGHKKRKHVDDEDSMRKDKYYGKKNKCNGEDDEEMDEDMIFMLGGSLRDNEREVKHGKKRKLPDPPDDLLDPMMYNEGGGANFNENESSFQKLVVQAITAAVQDEISKTVKKQSDEYVRGENEDPRPFSKRSPSNTRRDKLKKDRGVVRGVNVGLLKRRGRVRAVQRKEKPQDTPNDVCLYFMQGKCQRGSECPYSHSFNQPRKLEVCKFYLNDCCKKRDKCIYMHSDFPCKYFHTPGSTCYLGKGCKFSHAKLDEVQRAVLKKYSEMPLKELDDINRYYRENNNNITYQGRNKDKKDSNSRIPSLFDIKVSVPPEFRGSESIMNENVEEIEGDGITTPIPSPQSMMYESTDFEEIPQTNSKHHNHKVLSEHNEHRMEIDERDTITNRLHDEEVWGVSYLKKKSKNLDDHSHGEVEKSKKHSEKRKKRSKKEDRKAEKEKKKEKKHKRHKNKIEHSEHNDFDQSFSRTEYSFQEDAFEISSEEKGTQNFEQEHDDALSRLPKKQQELFLRIQQHQKEVDNSQNADVDNTDDKDDSKADVNWYSSDEEEQEQNNETTSPLATLLRTIQTSTSNVPNVEKLAESVSMTIDTFTPTTISSISSYENDSISIVDPSQLANISLSDEVTKLLTSMMKTDASNNDSEQTSYTPPSGMDKEDHFSIKPREENAFKLERLPNDDDEDIRFSSNNLINNPLFSPIDSTPPDIDLEQLPFKPVPLHDAANEINASITSHPPMEYKLKPLPFIPKVNYASLHDAAKICPNDPRFKRKLSNAKVPAIDPAQLLATISPNDPRYVLTLKSVNESMRIDPRIADTRSRLDPRLDGKNIVSTVKSGVKATADPRTEKEQARQLVPQTVDFRDPRLTSRNKFAEIAPFPVNIPFQPIPTSTLPLKETIAPRKEDPRLRFRANQNV